MTGSDNKHRLDAFAVARAAGLGKAVEQFPDCVADAAKARGRRPRRHACNRRHHRAVAADAVRRDR